MIGNERSTRQQKFRKKVTSNKDVFLFTDWSPGNESDDVALNHPRIWWHLHDFVSVLARLADAGALDGRRSMTESAHVDDRDLPRRQTLKRVHDVVPRLQTTGCADRRAQYLVRRPCAPPSRRHPFEN
jgi:hypothetical protein